MPCPLDNSGRREGIGVHVVGTTDASTAPQGKERRREAASSTHCFAELPRLIRILFLGLDKAEECANAWKDLLILICRLLLIGALPSWGYSRDWGYYPGGGLGIILIIVIILVLMGRI